jgi:hypothetical protein
VIEAALESLESEDAPYSESFGWRSDREHPDSDAEW